MRWLALLLLLLNVAIYGYFRLEGVRPAHKEAGHAEIQPEKIRILSATELAALPKKPEPPPVASPQPVPEPVACYEWGSFPPESAARAREVLGAFSAHFEPRQPASQETRRYWVYIPPLSSAEKAQAKNGEVRALGVVESYVVQEPKWRNAISFGVFKDEALAARLLEDLRAKGVRTAIKGVRNQEGGQSSFFIRNLTDRVAGEIGRLQPDFPGSELKKMACP